MSCSALLVLLRHSCLRGRTPLAGCVAGNVRRPRAPSAARLAYHVRMRRTMSIREHTILCQWAL